MNKVVFWHVMWAAPPTPRERWKSAWSAARKPRPILFGGAELIPLAKRLLEIRNA